MAGQGFKDFAVGEVLTSSDVDGFLMQQSVMRFADDGARGSALGTAVGTGVPLAEGMVAYLDDLDSVQVYDGAVWQRVTGAGIGTNVVQTVKTDTFTQSLAANTDTADITGLTATITPTSDTSKVLVVITISLSSAANRVYATLFRNSSSLTAATGGAGGSRPRITLGTNIVDANTFSTVTSAFLDSPATVSATTYSIRLRTGDATTTRVVSVNRSTNDNNSAEGGRPISSISLIEVAA